MSEIIKIIKMSHREYQLYIWPFFISPNESFDETKIEKYLKKLGKDEVEVMHRFNSGYPYFLVKFKSEFQATLFQFEWGYVIKKMY